MSLTYSAQHGPPESLPVVLRVVDPAHAHVLLHLPLALVQLQHALALGAQTALGRRREGERESEKRRKSVARRARKRKKRGKKETKAEKEV